MYRLVLYYLFSLLGLAVVLSFLNILPYDWGDVVLSSLLLLSVCLVVNKFFARVFKVAVNWESTYITALILSLIVGPVSLLENLWFLIVVAMAATASKYLLVVKNKHIFNPAGLGVLFTGIFLTEGASWWVGNVFMLPLVLVGGLLVLYKIKRFRMVGSFLIAYLLLFGGVETLAYSPILFFSFVMLVEPATTPEKSKDQVTYGLLVAAMIFVYQSVFRNTPYILVMALLTGNLYTYFAAKSYVVKLKFLKKRKIANETYEFLFKPKKRLVFVAGQFLEWTLEHKNMDSRGSRRYFTVSSSPSSELVKLTTKIFNIPSSFKKALMKMKEGELITALGPKGEFVLPKNKKTKLAFIAGGIGATPFLSMVELLVNRGEKRDIRFIYINKTKADIAYKNVFDDAKKKVGLETFYLLTSKSGYLNGPLLKKWVGDYQSREFYVSGPVKMVKKTEQVLKRSGVGIEKIKKDYFPGY